MFLPYMLTWPEAGRKKRETRTFPEKVYACLLENTISKNVIRWEIKSRAFKEKFKAINMHMATQAHDRAMSVIIKL